MALAEGRDAEEVTESVERHCGGSGAIRYRAGKHNANERTVAYLNARCRIPERRFTNLNAR
jgi:hypothetical protein